MSDTQAEVCQDIVNVCRKSFPRPIQITLERTPEIPAPYELLIFVKYYCWPSSYRRITSPQARGVLSSQTKLDALYRE